MTMKKNRVSIFGKTFHVTPAGKILPLGSKNNPFTKCMSRALKGNMQKGTNLGAAALQSNENTFAGAVVSCKPFAKTPGVFGGITVPAVGP